MYKFPLGPISIMSALVLFAMLTLNFGAAFGKDNASKTYRCAAKDAVGIEENGTLDKSDPGAEISRQHFDRRNVPVAVEIGRQASIASGH
jgi:hypothetical protein